VSVGYSASLTHCSLQSEMQVADATNTTTTTTTTTVGGPRHSALDGHPACSIARSSGTVMIGIHAALSPFVEDTDAAECGPVSTQLVSMGGRVFPHFCQAVLLMLIKLGTHRATC